MSGEYEYTLENCTIPYDPTHVVGYWEPSGWACDLFGGTPSPIPWFPDKKSLPNAWVRFWMRIFFNSQWRRV